MFLQIYGKIPVAMDRDKSLHSRGIRSGKYRLRTGSGIPLGRAVFLTLNFGK